jgi:DNA-binding transcriptional MocR family regulator
MKHKILYLEIANNIEYQIANGVLKVGDKLPSLRALALEKGVSIATTLQAYLELEGRGLITPRPQSGYFVSSYKQQKMITDISQPIRANKEDEVKDIMSVVIKNFIDAEIMLSSASLDPELVPIAQLNKSIMQATRTFINSGVNYSPKGSLKLKTQIAKRALNWGGNLQASDIIATGGCTDAISFCLLSLTRRGDTIVVESPAFFGMLRLAQSLGLHVIELPTHPIMGIEVDELKKVVEKTKIAACILVSNYSNPIGSCMPDENKKAVVQLMEKHNVPLIEDDVYGDLHFGNQRPNSCKTFDESGNVLWCGSFSKSLASGYRVGWVAPGKFKEQVERTKHFHSMYSSTIPHEAIGNFLESGKYETHLKKIRQNLYLNLLNFQRCIVEYFPEDTKLTNPSGGLNLWIEFNKKIDTVELYNKAIQNKISISPGRLYSLQNQYNHCLKLSYGRFWSDKIEHALKIVGKLACKL